MKSKFAVTHPGKLGDLIYSLPSIRDLSLHLGTSVDILISSLCISARSLLQYQPYINKVIIDYDYKPVHEHRGFQPHNLNFPDNTYNYESIFHLGYREKDEYPLEEKPLRGYGYYILKRDYGINLSPSLASAISLPSYETLDPFIIFQGLGETLDMVMGSEKVDAVCLEWSNFLKSTGKNIIAITGPKEAFRYQKSNINYLVSTDLLQAAIIISSAKLVVSVQSVITALANEIDLPRVILGVFPNALPSTSLGKVVPLFSNMEQKNELRNYIMTIY